MEHVEREPERRIQTCERATGDRSLFTRELCGWFREAKGTVEVPFGGKADVLLKHPGKDMGLVDFTRRSQGSERIGKG